MSDIVERLRELYDACIDAQRKLDAADKAHRGADWLAVTDPLTGARNQAWERFDAALLANSPALMDAIATLRAENAAATDLVNEYSMAIIRMQGERDTLRAENERLATAMTSALKRLEKGAPGWGVAKDELRAALKERVQP